jgi:hypothetical protein
VRSSIANGGKKREANERGISATLLLFLFLIPTFFAHPFCFFQFDIYFFFQFGLLQNSTRNQPAAK